MTNRRDLSLLASGAALLSILCAAAAMRSIDTFYASRQIWVEQVAYLQFPGIQYLGIARESGRLAAAATVLRDRERSPLQPLLFSLVWPELLGYRHAHLFITVPALWGFLWLLGMFTLKRVGSLSYAAAPMMLFLASAGLTDSRYGIASGFADEQSFLLLAVGCLCLLLALQGPADTRARWHRWAAFALCLAVLARTTVGFHAAVIAGPILMLTWWREYQSTRVARSVILLAGQFFAILLPALALVAWQTGPLLWYYTSANAWNLKQPLPVSAATIGSLLYAFTGSGYILLCGLVFGTWIALRITQTRSLSFGRFGETELALIWWPTGFLLCLLYLGYISDVPKEVMYVVPGLTTLAAVPFSLTGWRQTEQ